MAEAKLKTEKKVDAKVKTTKVAKTVKVAKIEAATEVKVVKTAKKEAMNLSVPLFDLSGNQAGTFSLPEEIFGVVVNKDLLSQAMRVYYNNKHSHNSNTKTRGEVEGSTRKIYKQKGTGKARHGAIRAPIFVGGGIALGPKSRRVTLELPKKMRRAALLSALSQKVKNNEVLALSNGMDASGKTKELATLVKKISKRQLLLVADKTAVNLTRSVKNLKSIRLIDVDRLNAYEVVGAREMMLTKEAIEVLKNRGEKNA